MARVTQQEAATRTKEQLGPKVCVGGSPPSPPSPAGLWAAQVCPISTPPAKQGSPPPKGDFRGNPAHRCPLLPRGRAQADHTGPAPLCLQKKGSLGRPGLCSTARVLAGLPAPPGGPVPGRTDKEEGSQGAWLQAHPTPLPPSQPQGGGVPTVCLGVPGETGPCLGSRLAPPRQPGRKGHGTGGRQQRHTGRYLAMFFYFQF